MEDSRNAIKRYMAVRLIVTTVILLAAVFTVDASVRIPFIILVGIAYMTGIMYTILLKRGQHLNVLVYMQVFVDVAIISAFVSITQSINSPLVPLYIFCIFAAGVLLSFKGCIIVATLSSTIYSGIIFLEYRGLFNPPPFSGLGGMDSSDIFFSVYSKVCAFYLVAFLSASLAVSQKKRTEKMSSDLMRADKLSSLGQLSASLIHEIKNPLSAIRSSAEYLLKDGGSDVYVNRLLGIIAQETKRLDQLITQFLSFARGGVKPGEDPCDISAILEETLLLLAGPISRNTRIFREVKPGTAVRGNAEQVKQVFLNILLNGLQAMPGGGEMRVAAYPLNGSCQNGHDGFVRIDFSDTGCGISEKNIGMIFEPFFTTREGGTGLGLAVVRQIVELNGGKIEVASTGGKGTTFSVYFPVFGRPVKGIQ